MQKGVIAFQGQPRSEYFTRWNSAMFLSLLWCGGCLKKLNNKHVFVYGSRKNIMLEVLLPKYFELSQEVVPKEVRSQDIRYYSYSKP